MRKTKFWLIQIMMVAIVSLVLGSPVFADDDDDDDDGRRSYQQWKYDDDDDDDDGFNDEKWHARLDKWYDRKMYKRPGKAAKWERKYDRKLARHNAKYHGSETVLEPAPEPTPDPTNCVTTPQMNPLTFMIEEVVVCT